MNTVLITGAAGLLGSRLIDWIIDNTFYSVVAVDDLSGGYLENIRVHDRVRFFQMDAADNSLERQFQLYKPVYVFHLAAYAAEGVSPFMRKFNYKNNLITTANIVNLCIKYDVKRLVFTSSMCVYGNAIPPFSEDMIPSPIDPYGVAKYAAEMDIKAAGEQHGLDWCIVRPHNVYGRKQNIWDSYRNVIGIFMYKALHNQPFTIYGDGTQTRAFSYIDDSLEPLWRSAIEPKASKQIINLGGIHEFSINEIAECVGNITGTTEIIRLPGRFETKHAWSTWQKSVDILGFEHKTSLQTGIEDMWAWAKVQPDRPRQVWENYEVEKGLYPYWKPEVVRNPKLLENKDA